MGKLTGIAWTDSTFNPWIGCTKVSPGCDNCYAEALDHRWGNDRWGKGKPRERTSAANWRKVEAWNAQAAQLGRRRRVFTASLADIFDAEVDPVWRAELFQVMRHCTALDFQVLTKRPQNLRKFLPKDWGTGYPNVWLGATVEAPRFMGLRLNQLCSVHAAVHFLSIEPQIEAIDFWVWFEAGNPGIDWMIIGGESGHCARPFDLAWARTAIEQGHRAGAKVFVKQLGAKPVDHGRRIVLADRAGADAAEWPTDLRVQEFPNARAA